MPLCLKMTLIGLLLLAAGCGGPIPSVRANAEPEGQFVRVKSASRAQAEQAHAMQIRREHVEALDASLSVGGATGVPAETRPASQPASEPGDAAPSASSHPADPGEPSGQAQPVQPKDH